MQKQPPNADELMKKVETFNTLVSIMPDDRCKQVKKMMENLPEYFTAPASSKLEFHSCYPGGLLVHSLNVVKNLRKISETLCPGKYSDATVAFVGLFHDLGKAGDGNEPMYVPNPSEWHREKLGAMYEINKNLQFMPNSERGLYVLQKFGVQVTDEEYLAIRLNDGQYPPENKPYGMREPDLALLTHWADLWSCKQEKSA
jgi:hypothetical protein